MEKEMEPTSPSPPSLLDFPDLVNDCIFSKCDFVTLCRLRLTSKMMNFIVTQHLPKLTFLRLEICENGPLTFGSAMNLSLELGIPIQELYINTSSDEIYYMDPSIEEFQTICGTGVEKLKVSEYFLDSPAMLDFMCGLPNLVELKIENIDARGYCINYIDTPNGQEIFGLPSTLQTLSILKFGRIQLNSILDTDFWYSMISGCYRLNFLRYPRVECKIPWEGSSNREGQKYGCLQCCIKAQRESFPESKGHWLKVIDFKHLDNPDHIRFDAAYMLQFAHNTVKGKGITLLNLHSDYLRTPMTPYPGEFYDDVESMLLGRTFPILSLERLQSVKVPSVGDVISNGWESSDFPSWGNVRSIRIHFDMGRYNMADAQEFVDYLLSTPGTDETASELAVTYDLGLMSMKRAHKCLIAKEIVSQVPLLTKLKLVGWNPVNKEFIRLWQGLPLLEEIWLENCPSLGNVALIGEDQGNPTILTLKCLRRLVLGLAEGQKVTDRTFKDVFRHMKLHEFTLKSTRPLTNITKTGITWLLEGEFATTIQKFPFHTWSSVHIPCEDMSSLKSMFKSLIY